MIADSVAFCREQGKRVVFDAEHFFDGYRDDPGYAIECAARRGRRGGRERHPLRHQRRQPARLRRRGDRGRRRRARRWSRGRDPHPQRRRVRGRQLARRGRGRRPARPGNGQRLRRALRQRQPRLDPAGAAAEDGLRGRHRGAAGEPDPDRALPRRALQRDPRSPTRPTSAATPSPTRRGCTPPGSPPTPAPSSTSSRRRSATPATSSPRSSPARRRSAPRPSGPGSRSTRRRPARAVARLKEREHRGYHYEAAPASFELLLRREAGSYKPLFELESFRVTTEKRADGKVETEATIKVKVDGERYLRVAEGNGPVNALDRALRGAIVDRHPHLADIELTNYKVRILDESHGTGAVTRVLLDSSDGEREWGTIGVSENIIEASWEALVDSLEYAFQRMSDEPDNDPIPLARPEIGEREEELVLEVLRSGRLSLGPMVERFERAFAAWLGVEDAVAVSSGTTALHLGVRALGWGEGDEVLTSPLQLRRLGQLPALRGRAAGLLRRRPRDPRPRPRRRRRRDHRAHRPGSCPSTSSATRRRCPSWRRSRPVTASESSRTPARRSARSTPRAGGSAPAATSPPSASTRTSS